jgi:glucose/arabinose dehydrogenase
MMKTVNALVLLVTLVLCAQSVYAQDTARTEYQPLGYQKITDGLAHPWSLAFLPDGTVLITERGGELKHVTLEGTVSIISGTPRVSAFNQGGLLEVLPHPKFAENRIIYLTYSKPDPEGTELTATALARGFLINGEILALEDIFVQDRYSSPGRHYGSKLAWLPDGTLLMSIGDRGTNPPRAQDLSDHAGKVLRLTELGKAPKDNPFVDQADTKPEILSFGNRNIQGLYVNPTTGEIWATEHGPRGGDELNRIVPGSNYGWPIVSLGRDYRTEEQFAGGKRQLPGVVDPYIDWTPGIAPSGLVQLTDDHFAPWQGNLLAGGLRTQQLRRIVFEDGEVVHQEEVLRGLLGRVRDVRIGPDSNIYVITDEPNGALFKIYPIK